MISLDFSEDSKVSPRKKEKKAPTGNFLAVQWLQFGVFTAEGPGSIPGSGTKIPEATWCRQGKKKSPREIQQAQQEQMLAAQQAEAEQEEMEQDPGAYAQAQWEAEDGLD